MKQGMKIVGCEGLIKKLKAHPDLIARTQVSVVVQEARALCVAYGSASLPGPGFDEGKAVKFRARVEKEVGQVFATKAGSGRVYALIRRRNKRLAAAYLRATKENKPDQVKRILLDAGIAIESLNPQVHRAARTGKHASVPRHYASVTLVTETQARAYKRKKAALVGFAKAGWYAAAKSLGGRVRRNLVGEGGKRKTEEIFPGYVRKLARKFPGIGGARVVSTRFSARVEIFTNVNHARNAMSEGEQAVAVGFAERRLKKALTESVRAINKKQFRAA